MELTELEWVNEPNVDYDGNEPFAVYGEVNVVPDEVISAYRANDALLFDGTRMRVLQIELNRLQNDFVAFERQ